MRTINVFAFIASLSAGVLLTPAHADTFDDAVNLYLKGFDHCSTAKQALGSNDLGAARSAFAKYESIKKQAEAMDGSIVGTSKRGMDSNLKYCTRVGTDIEVAVGMPTLEKALAACELALTNLKDGQVEPAKSNYQQFVAQRDEALRMAPSLNNVFSARSEIRRCERMESKIASFGQKQAALTVALQSALDASETFQSSCESALAELNGAAPNAAVIQAGKKAQAKVQTYQKSAADEYAALKTAAKGATINEKTTIEGRIAKGNQCLTQLSPALATKERALKTAQDELARQMARLDKANQACAASGNVAVATATQTQYDQARANYESARKTRDEVKAALAKNPQNGSDGNGQDVGVQVATLDACLDTSRRHLSALLGAVTAAAAAKPVAAKVEVAKVEPAKVVAAAPAPVASAAPVVAVPVAVASAAVVTPAKSSGIPPLSVTGVLDINDIVPDFAVLYWQDGSSGESAVEVVVHPTGFDQPVYFLNPGGSVQIRSEDFAPHRIFATNDAGESQMLAQIRSRQGRTVKTGWSENSICVLRSDQVRVAQSYVVNIKSASSNLLKFTGNSKKLEIDLKNPKNARKGYLLMPDYDPLAFELSQGEDKQLSITKSGAVVGSLTLKGN